MIDQNFLLTIILTFLIPVLSFLYYFQFRNAIHAALEEHQHGTKFINRLALIPITFIVLVAYAFIAKPFWKLPNESVYEPAPIVLAFIAFCVLYLALEIPYQLVKMAAKDMAEELVMVGDDKRNAARLKSAQTLASIIHQKLNVSCELQAYSGNEEFIFLTYIVNNKPIATRLKLNQADKAENWKKLGEWVMKNYQKENPPQ